MKTTLQILKEARQSIEDSNNWCQKNYIQDNKFCALGSLLLGKNSDEKFVPMAEDLLYRAAHMLYGKSVIEVNDKLGHEAVMKIYDFAMETSASVKNES